MNLLLIYLILIGSIIAACLMIACCIQGCSGDDAEYVAAVTRRREIAEETQNLAINTNPTSVASVERGPAFVAPAGDDPVDIALVDSNPTFRSAASDDVGGDLAQLNTVDSAPSYRTVASVNYEPFAKTTNISGPPPVYTRE
ncbi:hypothetical protein CAAN1_19S02080 [[Candida] anglica]|uniref:Secreted protein n=1 Tax=[Candida] anglica TaxID=148631 RepID=A0ABP0E5L7_9ASCO